MQTLSATDELLTCALQYAQRGWLVLPLHTPEKDGQCSCGKNACSSVGKHPRTQNGMKDATTNIGTIRYWWQKWPYANVGIATGLKPGIVVIDIDYNHGGDDSLAGLLRTHGPLPETWESLTGGGGRHIFFKHPGGVVKNKVGLAPGIDVRGDGGYIVAPPSVHASGRTYTWELSATPGEVPLADIPPWLLQLLNTAPHQEPASTSFPDAPIPEGLRNNTLTSLAGSMRRRGMGESAIAAALLAKNKHRCQPPLPEQEVRGIAQSVMRYPPLNNGQPSLVSSPSLPLPDCHLTDMGNAKRLVAQHGQDLRYCYLWKKWLVWDGICWQQDVSGAVERRAKQTTIAIYKEAATATDEDQRKNTAKHAIRSESASRIEAMVKLSRSEPDIPIQPDNLDTDPWLLNVQNGTLDLRTGILRPHRREDLVTMLAPIVFDPSARCPQWEAFLHRIMDGKITLVGFLQRAVGYALTGSIREQVLFLLYGIGSNGKSTFLAPIRILLGDYAQQAEFASFLVRDHDKPRNDLAALRGARFVCASEASSDRRLDEVIIKQVTGGDRIRVRRLYEEAFEFTPQFKLFLATNHKPIIRGTDYAIWRRILQIPFEVRIPEAERDKELFEKLLKELPGILNWALEGCRLWQERGLEIPDVVRTATAEYREEMDILGGFLGDCCILASSTTVTSRTLYNVYEQWCEANGEHPLGKNAFGTRLAERGLGKIRMGTSQARGWSGIGLKTVSNEP